MAMSEMTSARSNDEGANPFAQVAKRVAIRLRGLAGVDRQWMLQRLTAPQRAAVIQAERELTRIIGQQALDFSVFLDGAGGPAQIDAGLNEHAINRCDYLAVKQVLDQLPVSQSALLVASGVWLATDRYLKALAPKRRKALESATVSIPSRRFARAVADAVVSLVKEPTHG